MPAKQSKATKKMPVKRGRDDNVLQHVGDEEGAANANLAVVDDRVDKCKKRLYDALLSEVSSLHGAGKYADAVSCYLAAQRLRSLTLNDDDVKTNDGSKDWLYICSMLMNQPSTSAEAAEVDSLLHSWRVVTVGVGWLELFSIADLCYIVLGYDDVGTAETSRKSKLREACSASKPSLDPIQIQSRFNAIGFVRFKQWLRCVKRDPTSPPPPPDTQEYEKLSLTPARFTSIDAFLRTWERSLETEAKSLYGIVHAQKSFRNVDALMSEGMISELNKRAVGHDETEPLISTLDSLLKENGIARKRTLVVSGESGSGKTMSFLALATLEKEFICVYMTAEQLVTALKNRCSVKVDGKDLITDTAVRDRTVAEGIVRVLLSMAEREFKERLPVRSTQRVLICVDEAGEYPNVVRAMCALPALTIPADLLPAADAGKKVTLQEYLNVPEIQLIVSGTGVDADKFSIGSALEKYYHVVMDSDRAKNVLKTLNSKLRGYLPCLRAYRKARHNGAVCSVLRRLDAVKSNARMFAAFVGEVLDSIVFSTLNEETLHLKASTDELHLSRWLLVDAVYYSELKACLSRAMFQFKSANGLSKQPFLDALRAVFVSLSYCCLPVNYCGEPAPLVYQAKLGILVDQAEGVDPSRGGTLPTEPGKSYRHVIESSVWLREDLNHRYSVSAAHSEFALSSLGIREPVWTRLGFERAVMDMCYLHTCMALCSTLQALTLKGDESTVSPCEDLPAHAIPVEAKHATLFNDPTLDPLRWLKAELWTEAQKLKDADSSEAIPVFILTTTLAKPKAKDEQSWPSEGGSKKKRVMPDHWLATAIRQRAEEYVKQGVFSNSTVREVKLIVIAMTYQDAPGVDGVIAYGTCRKDWIGTKGSFVMATLVKLQMKYHVTNSELISSTGVIEEGQVQSRDTTAKNNRKCLSAVELDYLSRMGYVEEDAAASATKILHRLVIFDETAGPRAHLYRASINSKTLAEALHPTTWDGNRQRTNEHDEVVTHAIGLKEEMLLR